MEHSWIIQVSKGVSNVLLLRPWRRCQTATERSAEIWPKNLAWFTTILWIRMKSFYNTPAQKNPSEQCIWKRGITLHATLHSWCPLPNNQRNIKTPEFSYTVANFYGAKLHLLNAFFNAQFWGVTVFKSDQKLSHLTSLCQVVKWDFLIDFQNIVSNDISGWLLRVASPLRFEWLTWQKCASWWLSISLLPSIVCFLQQQLLLQIRL